MTGHMLLFGAVLLVGATAPPPAQWDLWSGVFHASETEAAECLFNVGFSEVVPGALLAFPPKSIACDVARHELRGKRGRLLFVLEE